MFKENRLIEFWKNGRWFQDPVAQPVTQAPTSATKTTINTSKSLPINETKQEDVIQNIAPTANFNVSSAYSQITGNESKYPDNTKLSNASNEIRQYVENLANQTQWRGKNASQDRQNFVDNTITSYVDQLNQKIEAYKTKMEGLASTLKTDNVNVRSFLAGSPDKNALSKFTRKVEGYKRQSTIGVSEQQIQKYIETGDPTYINKPESLLSSDLKAKLGNTTTAQISDAPKAGQTITQFYYDYKKNHPEKNFAQIKAIYDQNQSHLNDAISPDTGFQAKNEGTVAEQNKTGMSYPNWIKAQPKGADTSYYAWLHPEETQQGTSPASGSENPPTDGGTSENIQPSGTTQSGTTFDVSAYKKNAKEYLLKLVQSGSMSEDEYNAFSGVIDLWNPNEEIDFPTIIGKLDEISRKTIDPYFAEKTKVFKNDLTNTMNTTKANRELSLEAERTNAGQNIRQMKEGLEKSGMTFTGKAIEELGKESAYAQGASQGEVPKQEPTFGMFYEGNVNQQNRLLSSGSQLRYQNQLSDLGKQAEQTLGQTGIAGYDFGNYNPMGVSKGSLAREKTVAKAGVLGSIADQSSLKTDQSKPIDVSKFLTSY